MLLYVYLNTDPSTSCFTAQKLDITLNKSIDKLFKFVYRTRVLSFYSLYTIE